MRLFWRLLVLNCFLAVARADRSSLGKEHKLLEALLEGPRQDLLTVERRESEQIPAHIPESSEPSCGELRAMWRHMKRMSRHSEITNEIPQIPYPGDLFGYYTGRTHVGPFPETLHDKSHRHRSLSLVPFPLQDQAAFGNIIQNPRIVAGKQHLPRTRGRKTLDTSSFLGFTQFGESPYISEDVRHRMGNNGVRYLPQETSGFPGRFSNIPMPESTLGAFGTVVLSPEEKAHLDKDRRLLEEAEHMAATTGIAFEGVQPKSRHRVGAGADFGTFGDFASEEVEKPGDRFHYGSVMHAVPPHKLGRPHLSIGHTSLPGSPGMSESSFGDDFESFDTFGSEEDQGRSLADCHRLEGKTCRTSTDCLCHDSSLHCTASRCRSSFRKQVFSDEWGMWHNGPLESGELGISRQKRNVVKSIVM